MIDIILGGVIFILGLLHAYNSYNNPPTGTKVGNISHNINEYFTSLLILVFGVFVILGKISILDFLI